MNEDQRRELLLLATGLETLPPEKFNMWDWGTGISDGGELDCGFVGCAIGWATRFIPGCQLVLVRSGMGFLLPAYSGAMGVAAISLYFGISPSDAMTLFAPVGYIGLPKKIDPGLVAEKIKTYLAGTWNRE